MTATPWAFISNLSLRTKLRGWLSFPPPQVVLSTISEERQLATRTNRPKDRDGWMQGVITDQILVHHFVSQICCLVRKLLHTATEDSKSA